MQAIWALVVYALIAPNEPAAPLAARVIGEGPKAFLQCEARAAEVRRVGLENEVAILVGCVRIEISGKDT